MSKDEFTGGIPVRPEGGGPVMTLGGNPDSWICAWEEDNGQIVMQTFMPEQLQRVVENA